MNLQKVKLTDLELSESSTISRVFHRTENAVLTIFLMDKGQKISEHKSSYDAVVYLIEGQLDVTLAGELHRLNTGDILLMPRDIPHALEAQEPARWLLFMLK